MFKTKPVNTLTLGEYLAMQRARVGLSLAELSKVTKIPPKYLSSLEQGEYAKLPATVYVKGFLKTLADIYRIELTELLPLFETEKKLTDQLVQTTPEQKISRRIPKFVFTPRLITIGVLILLGLSSVSYLYFQISSVRRAPILEIFSPSTDGIVNSSFLLLEGRTEAGANVFLNNQPVVVDATGGFRENLSLAPGTNLLEIKATNKFDKSTVLSRQVILPEKQIAGAMSPPTTLSETNPKSITLEIRVGPNTAWVSLELDAQEIFTGTMLPGASRTITGEFVRVSTTNAGSVRIILNDRDLGVLGKEGETLRAVEFSR